MVGVYLAPQFVSRLANPQNSARLALLNPKRCESWVWEELGIGPGIGTCAEPAKLTAPHETALFAMPANRLDDPVFKLACAERWLPDVAWLPDATGLAVDQCYRALDFLAVWADEIEREVFLKAADLLRLDVDLIFYDTTTAYFEIDEPDEDEQEFAGGLHAAL